MQREDEEQLRYTAFNLARTRLPQDASVNTILATAQTIVDFVKGTVLRKMPREDEKRDS